MGNKTTRKSVVRDYLAFVSFLLVCLVGSLFIVSLVWVMLQAFKEEKKHYPYYCLHPLNPQIFIPCSAIPPDFPRQEQNITRII